MPDGPLVDLMGPDRDGSKVSSCAACGEELADLAVACPKCWTPTRAAGGSDVASPAEFPPGAQAGRLGVVETLLVAARLYRDHALTLLATVAPVVVPAQILAALVLMAVPDQSEVFIEVPNRLRFAPPEVIVDASALGVFLAGKLLAVGVTVVAFQFATATSLGALTDAYVGRRPPAWRESLSWGRRHFAPLRRLTTLWIALVAGGSVAGVVPGVWLYVSWAMAVPVLLLEEQQGSSAVLRRSLRLVRGCWWPVFAVLVLGRVIVAVPSLLIRSLSGSATDGGVTALLLDAATAATAETLITPFLTATVVILYCDLRMRKEGLDPVGLSKAFQREGAEADSG